MLRQSLKGVVLVLATMGLACFAEGKKTTHWVVGVTKDREVAIDPVSGRQVSRAREGRVYPSPDGSRVLEYKPLADAPHDWELFLTVRQPEGDGVSRQVTNDKGEILAVDWLPDNRRAVIQRAWMLVMLDMRPEQPTERRFGENTWSAYSAAVADDGRVAFLRHVRTEGKSSFEDLMVWDGSTFSTVVENVDFTTIAWSHDGKSIAWSTHGELARMDLATKAVLTLKYTSIKDDMWCYHAGSLAFSPDDSEIAATIQFSGGRLVVDASKPDVLFGDREVFIVPANFQGSPRWFTLDSDVRKVEWAPAVTPNGPEW